MIQGRYGWGGVGFGGPNKGCMGGWSKLSLEQQY